MIKNYYKILISFLSISLLLNSKCFSEENSKIPNIIIITLSGVSNDDSINSNENRNFKYLFDDIIKSGTTFTNLIDTNMNFHMPSVCAINSGIKHPFYSTDILYPSIFQYAKNQLNLSRTKLWLIGIWSEELRGKTTNKFSAESMPCYITAKLDSCIELNQLMSQNEIEQITKLKNQMTGWPSWDSQSDDVYILVERILKNFKPKLMHLILNDPETGHYDNYARYINSLIRSDNEINKIYNFINSDKDYKNNTYLIISSDHNRDKYFMNHNERPLTDNYPTWMFIYGPDIKKDTTLTNLVHHVDIFATIGKILKLNVHENNGRVLSECFINK